MKKINIQMLIISFFAGLLTWYLVMLQAVPIIETKITVPIEISLNEEIANSGKVFSIQGDKTVDVTLKIREDVKDKIDNTKVSFVISDIDLNTTTGYYYIYPKWKDNIDKKYIIDYDFEPKQAHIVTDNKIYSRIKVDYETVGRLEEGFVGLVNINPSVININGPSEELDNIYKAVILIDLDNNNDNFSGTGTVSFYDKNGEEIELSDNINAEDTVGYTVFVYATKTVDLNASTTGNVRNGFSRAGVSINPQKVSISGLKSTIDQLFIINLPTIDISGLDKNKDFEFDLNDILQSFGRVEVNSNNSKVVVTVSVNNERPERADVRYSPRLSSSSNVIVTTNTEFAHPLAPSDENEEETESDTIETTEETKEE